MHIYYIPCSLMASKSKRPKLSLPDPRELISQQKEQKGIGKSVEGAIHTLKDSNLFQLSERAQQSIPQATKVVWLITKYGFEEVHMLCRAIKNTPSALTPQQRLEFIQSQVTSTRLSPSSVKQLVVYIENHCPSLCSGSACESDLPVILAPPVHYCYECSEELVAYHSCKVRYFTCTGAIDPTKVTLRCIRCCLQYNYSQFGNKHGVGFRYYPETRPAVEITDGQLMERGLLEFQCCLA